MSGWAATVSAAALKRKPAPASAARRWTCRYSHSAVCGFVTVARLRQIPAASSRKHDPRCRQHQTVRLGKGRFAAAISAFATRRVAPGSG